MQTYTDDYVKKIFRFLLDKDLSGAKNMLNENITINNDEERGKHMALKGLVVLQENKKNEGNFFEEDEKMSRLKKLLVKHIASIWSDDFDKGYFETYVKFINFLKRNNLFKGKESIDKNPSE